jgi:hypothetical protein
MHFSLSIYCIYISTVGYRKGGRGWRFFPSPQLPTILVSSEYPGLFLRE